MLIDLSNLQLIPVLLDEVKQLKHSLENLQNKNKPKLTTLTNVAKFLNVSKMTVYNMLEDGRFKENIHFKKQMLKNKVKIIFVESAIIKFQKENL
jgi:DNA-binding XRE family transcriptional regulator